MLPLQITRWCGTRIQLVFALAITAACSQRAAPTSPAATSSTASTSTPASPTIRNPVIDRDFADPAVLHAKDGLYYAYASQAVEPGYKRNIQVMSSVDIAGAS